MSRNRFNKKSIGNGSNSESIRHYEINQNGRKLVHIILPAYNEEQSLPRMFDRFGQLKNKSDLVIWVVDDGSSDNTAIIAGKGKAGLNVHLLQHQKNMGLGQALVTGVVNAMKIANSSDIIIVMDADDTQDVKLMYPMIKEINAGADIIIASRFIDGGADKTAPILRRILSRSAVAIFKAILPLKDLRDFTGGYRAYRSSLLKHAIRYYGESLIEEKGFACMVELLLKLRYLNPIIKEIPFELRYDRKKGKSKIKILRTIIQYLKLLMREWLKPFPHRLLIKI